MKLELEDNEYKFKQMREVGKLTSECLHYIGEEIEAGMSTADIEHLVLKFSKKHNLRCATQGYKGFPGDCCVSLNEMACHGIPSRIKIIEDGDIVSVDVTFINEAGYHGDSCVTFEIGNVSKKHHQLVHVAQYAMLEGIAVAKPGNKIMDIGKVINEFVEKNKMRVIKQYCGHGIGKTFHAFPLIPHAVDKHLPDSNIVLQPGMTFTIEPIISLGKDKTKVLKDNWGVVTKDKKWTAQFEHTIGITNDGNEVFTA